MKKLLIVYYSWAHGNTARIAQMLQKATGADAVRIETLTPYPQDYQTVVAQGQAEVQRSYKPAIRSLSVSMDDYDVIAVGTPTWWYTMAPAVRTLLAGQNWMGKTVVPFMTHGGWPGHVIQDMASLCKDATILCPMEVQFDSDGGDHMETPQTKVDHWTRMVQNLLDD